jgi:polyhydroxyalkanoic acid synthase PhaR subunit
MPARLAKVAGKRARKMSDENKTGLPIDPFSFWKQMNSSNEEMLSKAMNQFVNSETYASSMGKYMENAMASQKSIQESMEKYLHANGLPTRNDFTRLSAQIVDIDGRLDDIQMQMEDTAEKPALQPEIRKLSGQVGSLEVRLSKIENTLEQIMRALSLPKTEVLKETPVESKGTSDNYYSLGEASPVSKKPARKKVVPDSK